MRFYYEAIFGGPEASRKSWEEVAFLTGKGGSTIKCLGDL